MMMLKMQALEERLALVISNHLKPQEVGSTSQSIPRGAVPKIDDRVGDVVYPQDCSLHLPAYDVEHLQNYP